VSKPEQTATARNHVRNTLTNEFFETYLMFIAWEWLGHLYFAVIVIIEKMN
jgi:hypothetical protein